MKYLGLLLVILLFAAFALPALSQEPVMALNHKELGKHERPIVQFNHEQHSAKIDCLQCHHDYDAYYNNRGGEGQPCTNCHEASTGKELPALKDAFHAQCKGCHQFMHSEGKQSGPTTCGGCHVAKK